MFDQIKKVQELKRLQDTIRAERETVQKSGITVTVNGAMEVQSITLNPALGQRETEAALRDCINDANRSLQKRLAKLMMDSGNFPGI